MNDLLLGISAVILHELSHVATARLQGLKVKRFGVTWKGPYIVREAGTWRQNLRVCLAGPLVNLLVAAVCWRSAMTFAVCNLVLGGFNLLPIPGSDGHRAWRLLPFAAANPVSGRAVAAPE
jgi:Zn-dependent protease